MRRDARHGAEIPLVVECMKHRFIHRAIDAHAALRFTPPARPLPSHNSLLQFSGVLATSPPLSRV